MRVEHVVDADTESGGPDVSQDLAADESAVGELGGEVVVGHWLVRGLRSYRDDVGLLATAVAHGGYCYGVFGPAGSGIGAGWASLLFSKMDEEEKRTSSDE